VVEPDAFCRRTVGPGWGRGLGSVRVDGVALGVCHRYSFEKGGGAGEMNNNANTLLKIKERYLFIVLH